MSEAQCRTIVEQRSGGICEVQIPGVCTGQAQSKHHRRKRSHTGMWVPSNILDACGDGTRDCHGWIEANPDAAQARGLWLIGAESPQFSPVLISWRGIMDWYILTDWGGLRWPGKGPGAEIPDPERLVR